MAPSPKFRLRPWTMDDLDSLVKHANNPKIARNLTDEFPSPYTHDAGMTFIERVSGHDPTLVFAIEVNGEAAGGIGIHPRFGIERLNAELGYWLSEDHWGKGIITAAARQMVEYAFKTLPIERLIARPFGSNLASRKLLVKAGFKLEARFKGTIIKEGEVEDEWVYAVRRSDLN